MPGNTEIPEIVIRFGLMNDVNKFVSHYGTIVLTKIMAGINMAEFLKKPPMHMVCRKSK